MENKEFHLPLLDKAISYYKHSKYSEAIEIFNDILPTLDQKSLIYSNVLLEYAICLIENANYQTMANYKKLLNFKLKNNTDKKNNDQDNNKEIDEDLEIAWDSLELCRVTFEIINDRDKLCKTHKGLGDIYNLNNEFEKSINEYMVAINYSDNKFVYAELIECIADNYEKLENIEKSIEKYQELIQIYKDLNNYESIEEIELIIKHLRKKIISKEKMIIINKKIILNQQIKLNQ